MEKKVTYFESGEIAKKIISNNRVTETILFYKNGRIYKRTLSDEKTAMEYLEYFSKSGELVTKVENKVDGNIIYIYDLLRKKYFLLKGNKLYYNTTIYSGRIKYYFGDLLLEEIYKRGKLDGLQKIYNFEKNLIYQFIWENGKLIDTK